MTDEEGAVMVLALSKKDKTNLSEEAALLYWQSATPEEKKLVEEAYITHISPRPQSLPK